MIFLIPVYACQPPISHTNTRIPRVKKVDNGIFFAIFQPNDDIMYEAAVEKAKENGHIPPDRRRYQLRYGGKRANGSNWYYVETHADFLNTPEKFKTYSRFVHDRQVSYLHI